MLTEKEITKINNYLVAIRALCVTAKNENTDSIIQLLYDIENITYREEKKMNEIIELVFGKDVVIYED